MTTQEILTELESYSDEQTKKTLIRHGAKEPFFGVKIENLKKILKKTKKNHELSLALFATGNSDAMYLAGLMADEKKITKDQLEEWAHQAYWSYLYEYAVAWVASETDFGFELGMKWIDSENPNVACCGWATLSNVAALVEDDKLDIAAYSKLLDRVGKTIHSSHNDVRKSMNAFVIGVGTYIKSLTEKALEISATIGKVEVYMGNTACKVPFALEYINKAIDKGRLGKKKKEVRC